MTEKPTAECVESDRHLPAGIVSTASVMLIWIVPPSLLYLSRQQSYPRNIESSSIERSRTSAARARRLGRLPPLPRGAHAGAEQRPREHARADDQRLRGAAAPRARRESPPAARRPRRTPRSDGLWDHAAPRRARACRMRREGAERVGRLPAAGEDAGDCSP